MTRRSTATACVAAAALLAACSGGGDDLAEFCALVVNPEPLPQTDDVAETLQFALDAEREIADKAPDAVRDEAKVLVDYVERLVEAYDAAGPQADLAAVTESVDDANVDAASAVIQGFALDNCDT